MHCIDVTSIVNAVLDEAKWTTKEDGPNTIEGEPGVTSQLLERAEVALCCPKGNCMST